MKDPVFEDIYGAKHMNTYKIFNILLVTSTEIMILECLCNSDMKSLWNVISAAL